MLCCLDKNSVVEAFFTIEFLPKHQIITLIVQHDNVTSGVCSIASNMAWASLPFLVSLPSPASCQERPGNPSQTFVKLFLHFIGIIILKMLGFISFSYEY